MSIVDSHPKYVCVSNATFVGDKTINHDFMIHDRWKIIILNSRGSTIRPSHSTHILIEIHRLFSFDEFFFYSSSKIKWIFGETIHESALGILKKFKYSISPVFFSECRLWVIQSATLTSAKHVRLACDKRNDFTSALINFITFFSRLRSRSTH